MRPVYTVLWSRDSFIETTTSTGSTTTATLSYVLGQWAMKSSVMYMLDHSQRMHAVRRILIQPNNRIILLLLFLSDCPLDRLSLPTLFLHSLDGVWRRLLLPVTRYVMSVLYIPHDSQPMGIAAGMEFFKKKLKKKNKSKTQSWGQHESQYRQVFLLPPRSGLSYFLSGPL